MMSAPEFPRIAIAAPESRLSRSAAFSAAIGVNRDPRRSAARVVAGGFQSRLARFAIISLRFAVHNQNRELRTCSSLFCLRSLGRDQRSRGGRLRVHVQSERDTRKLAVKLCIAGRGSDDLGFPGCARAVTLREVHGNHELVAIQLVLYICHNTFLQFGGELTESRMHIAH